MDIEASLTLLNLAGSVALLLWGLYMIQSGIMRAFGTEIRRFLGVALRNRFKSFFAGLFATMCLQSSTATGMMATSFTASRLVGLVPALALMLGANVGSTIIVQLLSFDIKQMAPFIVLVGVVIFKKSARTHIRDFSRAVIGLGLMLFALEHMVLLLKPAENSDSIKLLLSTISQDHILDMLFGAVLTWAMHSSIAVVLVAISFATQGLITIDVAFAMVLGANLGSAINPLIESNSNGNPASHRLPFGNLINRAVGCLLFIPLLAYVDKLPPEFTADTPKAIAMFHTFFNVAMALIFLPMLPALSSLLTHILPDRTSSEDLSEPQYLDPSAVENPSLAISNAARETLRMADLAEKMLKSVMDMFTNDDRKKIVEINKMDDVMDKLNRQIKVYVTGFKIENLNDMEVKRASEVMSFATNLEHIGDVISTDLNRIGAKKIERKATFSSEGWSELRAMLERVTSNVRLASSVFMTRELRAAKQLMAEKGAMREMETQATEMHFKRLREGRAESIETSTLHLDIVRDLKRINSHLTATAVHVLQEHNVLLPSRMKDE